MKLLTIVTLSLLTLVVVRSDDANVDADGDPGEDKKGGTAGGKGGKGGRPKGGVLITRPWSRGDKYHVSDPNDYYSKSSGNYAKFSYGYAAGLLFVYVSGPHDIQRDGEKTIAFLFQLNAIPPKDWRDINDATPGFLGLCKHLGPVLWDNISDTTLETAEPQVKDGFLRWFYHAKGGTVQDQDRSKASFCSACLTALGGEVAALSINGQSGMNWFHNPDECE